MSSLFGGDPSVSHYTTSIKFDYQAADRKKEVERRKAERKILKEAGYKERYFHFKNNDDRAQQRAKAQADAEAALWKAATGIQLEVLEGCFL